MVTPHHHPTTHPTLPSAAPALHGAKCWPTPPHPHPHPTTTNTTNTNLPARQPREQDSPATRVLSGVILSCLALSCPFVCRVSCPSAQCRHPSLAAQACRLGRRQCRAPISLRCALTALRSTPDPTRCPPRWPPLPASSPASTSPPPEHVSAPPCRRRPSRSRLPLATVTRRRAAACRGLSRSDPPATHTHTPTHPPTHPPTQPPPPPLPPTHTHTPSPTHPHPHTHAHTHRLY